MRRQSDVQVVRLVKVCVSFTRVDVKGRNSNIRPGEYPHPWDVPIENDNPLHENAISFYVCHLILLAYDDVDGSGIAYVALYVDDDIVQEWTTSGGFYYTGGPYSKGTHTCYAVAVDVAGNEAWQPYTGVLEFEVRERDTLIEVPLWVWLVAALILIVVITAGSAIVSERRRSAPTEVQTEFPSDV